MTDNKNNPKKQSTYYRGRVGPGDKYDIMGSNQFNLLTTMGLRDDHSLLDIGCGSLRGGRLFIPYLKPERYFGIEPDQSLIDAGIENELGEAILVIKKPTFSNVADFTLSVFKREFDFILAQSVFSHACPRQIRFCLAEAVKVMKDNTLFLATFCEGEENYEGDEWVYPRGITYTFSRIKHYVEENKFCCRKIAWPHPNLQTWFLICKPENVSNSNQLLPEAIFQRNLEDCYRERVAGLQIKLNKAESKLQRYEKLPIFKILAQRVFAKR